MRRIRNERWGRSRGHSFLELVTTMAILGIVMAIGLPNMANLRKPYKVMGAARQLAADVQLARQRAIARNARYRVTLNSATGSWRLERETTPGGNSWAGDGAQQYLPTGVSFGTTSGTLLFSSNGMLTTAVTVPVTMTGAHTRTVTVNVLGKTSVS